MIPNIIFRGKNIPVDATKLSFEIKLLIKRKDHYKSSFYVRDFDKIGRNHIKKFIDLLGT